MTKPVYILRKTLSVSVLCLMGFHSAYPMLEEGKENAAPQHTQTQVPLNTQSTREGEWGNALSAPQGPAPTSLADLQRQGERLVRQDDDNASIVTSHDGAESLVSRVTDATQRTAQTSTTLGLGSLLNGLEGDQVKKIQQALKKHEKIKEQNKKLQTGLIELDKRNNEKDKEISSLKTQLKSLLQSQSQSDGNEQLKITSKALEEIQQKLKEKEDAIKTLEQNLEKKNQKARSLEKRKQHYKQKSTSQKLMLESYQTSTAELSHLLYKQTQKTVQHFEEIPIERMRRSPEALKEGVALLKQRLEHESDLETLFFQEHTNYAASSRMTGSSTSSENTFSQPYSPLNNAGNFCTKLTTLKAFGGETNLQEFSANIKQKINTISTNSGLFGNKALKEQALSEIDTLLKNASNLLSALDDLRPLAENLINDMTAYQVPKHQKTELASKILAAQENLRLNIPNLKESPQQKRVISSNTQADVASDDDESDDEAAIVS